MSRTPRAPHRAAPRPAPAPHRAAPAAGGASAALRKQLRGVGFAAGEAMLSPAAKDEADAQGLLAQMPALEAQAGAAPGADPLEQAPAEPVVELGEDDLPQVTAAEGEAEAAADAAPGEPAALDDVREEAGGDPGDPDAVAPDVPGEKAAAADELGGGPGVEAAAPAGDDAGMDAAPALLADGAAPEAAAAPAPEAAAAPAPEAATSGAPAGGSAPAAAPPEAMAAPEAATGGADAGAPQGPEGEHAGDGGASEVEAPAAAGGGAAGLEARLQPQGGGAALPEPAREQLEEDLGVDLADVRVHQGGDAGAALGEVGAKASAAGKAVVLPSGGDLAAPSTMKVLRHEVSHLVQQAEGRADGLALDAPGTEGQRAALEQDADSKAEASPGQSSPRRRPGAGTRSRGGGRTASGAPRRKVAFRERAGAQFWGVNPADIARAAGKAGVKAAKAGGRKAVGAAKATGHAIKSGAKKAGSIVKAVASRGVAMMTGAIKGIVNGMTHLAGLARSFAGWLKKSKLFRSFAAKVESATDAALKARAEIETAYKRAAQLVAGAKALVKYAKRFRRRGPAYYDAAKAAVSRIVGAIRDPSALISVGKAAVRQAVAVVAAQARDAWKAAKRGMVAPFASLWTGLKTIGGSIKNAAAWTWERRQGFAKIVQGATELLSLLPPPVGPVAGLVNALTYAMQGDWKNAGFGLVSAIPLVGQAARAGKYGTRAAGYVVKIDHVVERGRASAQVLRKQAVKRASGLRNAMLTSRRQLAQGVGRVRRDLAARVAPLQRKYYDYKPMVAGYYRAAATRITAVKARYQPWIDRYHKWNDKITAAEELYGQFQSAGGSILEGIDDVIDPTPDPSSEGNGGGGW